MSHPFRHLKTILKHRHGVIANASHCGIFFHSLGHDLSKFGHTEFHWSAKYYNGHHSPVYEERLRHDRFSFICQHHAKRNKHHWEYWTDYFCGNIIVCTMPWKYATEYFCDTLSASKTYDPKGFSGQVVLEYFQKRKSHYYMTKATEEYIEWLLTRYAELGWAGVKMKDTKAKYAEITSRLPRFETISALRPVPLLPEKE